MSEPDRNKFLFSLEVYEIKIIVPICWGFKAEDKFKVTLREGDKTSGKLFNQEIGNKLLQLYSCVKYSDFELK